MLLILLINLSHWQLNRSICPKSTLPQFSFPSQRSLKKSVQPHTPWQSKYLTVLGYPLGSDSGNRRHQTSARTWARHTSLLRIWNQGQEWDCDCWEVSQPLRYRYRVVSHRWLSPAWRPWPHNLIRKSIFCQFPTTDSDRLFSNRYKNQTAIQTHVKSPYFRTFSKKLSTLLMKPAEIRAGGFLNGSRGVSRL